jgi:hypothetical protein
VTGCCEHGNEPLHATSAGNFWTEGGTLTHNDSAHLGSHFLVLAPFRFVSPVSCASGDRLLDLQKLTLKLRVRNLPSFKFLGGRYSLPGDSTFRTLRGGSYPLTHNIIIDGKVLNEAQG